MARSRGGACHPGGPDACGGYLPWPEATAVGGWWNRAFDPEADLIGADRLPVARKLWYAGSVKWLDHPFGTRELGELQRAAPQVPGFDPGETALISVSRTGFTDSAATGLALCWLPENVVNAFAYALTVGSAAKGGDAALEEGLLGAGER
jgi:uncharacterized protein